MTHHCHARGCTKRVRPELLMCSKHWYMVSKKIRHLVWQTYRPGQCDDRKPGAEWMKAAHAAIAYVARQENQPILEHEREAMQLVLDLQ